MTNLVYAVRPAAGGRGPAPVLARVHASRCALLDRPAELRTFRAVAATGVGPALLLAFGNGRLEEFLEGFDTLSAACLREPATSAAIAAAVAAFHRCLSPAELAAADAAADAAAGASGGGGSGSGGGDGGAGGNELWRRVRRWHALACSLWPAEPQGAGADAGGVGAALAALGPRIAALQAALAAAHPSDPVVCHNDLQYGNIMRRAAAPAAAAAPASPSSPASAGGSPAAASAGSAGSPVGSSGRSPGSPTPGGGVGGHGRGRGSDDGDRGSPGDGVRLIDFEYAGAGPAAFDVANHWCEWAADYHGAAPHALDPGRLPDGGQRRAFARAYVAEASRLAARAARRSGGGAAAAAPRGAGSPSSPGEAAAAGGAAAGLEAAAAALHAAADAHVPASHVHWALWGFVQARTSEVSGFDYLSYARQRLSLFLASAPAPPPTLNPPALAHALAPG
jgi:thiamine kinase-like enzyme